MIGFFGAELTLRVMMPDTDIRIHPKDGGLIRPYHPNSEADLITQEFRVRYKINEWGYRDKAGRKLEKPKDKTRILLLGDSYTEGFGVEMDETYASLLEKKETDWEIWNTARLGSSPLFYVYQLREVLPKLKPDLVIVQLFDNDLNENNFRRAVYKDNGELGPIPDSLRPTESWKNLLPRLTLYSAYKRLRRKMKGKALHRLFVKPGHSIPKESLVYTGPSALDEEFSFYDPKALKEWKERFQLQEVLVRQLIKEFRSLTPDSKLLILYVPHILAFELSVSAQMSDLNKVNPHVRLITKICKELKVPFANSTEFFLPDAPDYYYPQDLHWNAKGHQRAAERLHPIILKQLKNP